MAVTALALGYTPTKGIDYTHTVDGAVDHAAVPFDTYFYDLSDNLPYYKDGTGAVLSIFAAGGGADGNGIYTSSGSLSSNTVVTMGVNTLDFDSNVGISNTKIGGIATASAIGHSSFFNQNDAALQQTNLGLTRIGAASGQKTTFNFGGSETTIDIKSLQVAIGSNHTAPSNTMFSIDHDTGGLIYASEFTNIRDYRGVNFIGSGIFGTGISFQNAANTEFALYQGGSSSIQIGNGSFGIYNGVPLHPFTIQPNGNIGIGVNQATTKLEVGGDTKINGELTINTTTPSVIGQVWTATGTAGQGAWQAAGGGADGNGIFDATNEGGTLDINSILFPNNHTLRFDMTGNSVVHFNGSQGLQLGNLAGYNVKLGLNGSISGYNFGLPTTNPAYSFQTAGGSASFLGLFGNVGIGTRTPSAKLHVNGTVRLDVASTTSATGGAATALPAQPQGYLTINRSGVDYKIPYYN